MVEDERHGLFNFGFGVNWWIWIIIIIIVILLIFPGIFDNNDHCCKD